MSDKAVLITEEEFQFIEDVGTELLRRGGDDVRALGLLRVALKFKFAEPVKPPLPSNVLQFSRRVGA